MSKTLAAICAAKIVLVDGVPVPLTTILSEGIGASTGILVMDEDKLYYLTSNATDIKATMEKQISVITDLTAALNQIATTLASIGAGMTGPTTAPPPTLATDLVALAAKITSLTATSAQIAILKEALK